MLNPKINPKINLKRLIISRSDNLGDVVLTLPIAYWLKQQFPGIHIALMGRPYVEALVRYCPWINEFLLVDDFLPRSKIGNYDSIIHVFPRRNLAFLAKRANIPVRIGTARRWYHWLSCQYRPNFSRAKSPLHEAQLNFELLRPLGLKEIPSLDALCRVNSLVLPSSEKTEKTEQTPKPFRLIIHPFTHGHTREWPLSRFITLIKQIENSLNHSAKQNTIEIIITGSADEHKKLQALRDACPNITDLSGKLSLDELLQLIGRADGLIANGTGPLHIAAAFGIRTLGVFPAAKSIHPNRWQPLGPKAEYVLSDNLCDPKQSCDNQTCACIRSISPDTVTQRILSWLNQNE